MLPDFLSTLMCHNVIMIVRRRVTLSYPVAFYSTLVSEQQCACKMENINQLLSDT